MFNFFKPKKGCLDGKTPQQKADFFKSLQNFAATDEQFFTEQYNDLQPHEKVEFEEWLLEEHKKLKTISMLAELISRFAPKP